MAKTRDIKRRIKSVQNTQQITRTMEMVAASKLKRAQNRLMASRPYGSEIRSFIRELAARTDPAAHPLLQGREEERRVAIVLFTSNRGLCGAFNTNIIKKAQALYDELVAEGKEVSLNVNGRKGLSFFRFRGYPIDREYTDLPELPSLREVTELADEYISLYTGGDIDRLILMYNHFRSPVEQRPVAETVLPIPASDGTAGGTDYIMEPHPERILDLLLPLYVRSSFHMAMTESSTSEQGARRTAMKNATDNADEMIRYLIRSYNKARQAQITQEIAEIVGGADALSE
jgi:F-type H+-transporting ATPase subunit gamma